MMSEETFNLFTFDSNTPIKVGFVDYFDGVPEFFMDLFNDSREFTFVRDDENPNILFFCDENFGSRNTLPKYNKNMIRVFYTGENRRPFDYSADFAMTFDHFDTQNHMRVPLWMLNIFDMKRKLDIDISQIFHNRVNVTAPFHRDFCGYVQSNPSGIARNRLYHMINSHVGNINSAGPHFNNTGYIIPRGDDGVRQKMEFLGKHKFTVAMENSQYPGYVTEKILEAWLAGTVPIYWGSQTVSLDFNPKSFINWHDFKSDERFVDFIRIVNSSQELYNTFFDQPLLDDRRATNYYNHVLKFIPHFLDKIAVTAVERGYFNGV
jgi:alpha(1,3/1,4) fucosyltransferase